MAALTVFVGIFEPIRHILVNTDGPRLLGRLLAICSSKSSGNAWLKEMPLAQKTPLCLAR